MKITIKILICKIKDKAMLVYYKCRGCIILIKMSSIKSNEKLRINSSFAKNCLRGGLEK